MTNRGSLYQHLPKLATLDLLVEVGSFSAASTRAHVTRSALSQTVSSLESMLGFPLLVREGGHVRATPACRELLDRVRPVLASLDRIADEVGSTKSTLPELGSLDLGAYESLAITALPRLVRRLRATFPAIQLTVKIGRSGELVRLVRKGELCSAVVTEVDSLGDLSIVPLATDRFGVYLSADHPAIERGRAALDELSVGCLAPAKDGHPRYLARYLRAIKLPRPLVVSDSIEALRAMALEGVVAAVLPRSVAERGDHRLREIDVGAPERLGQHRIVLVSPKNCDQGERDYLARELRALFPTGSPLPS